jgi:hypothetical protein
MECELASTTVHCEVFGEGRLFLMLHGGVGDHRYWVRALDCAGHGLAGIEQVAVCHALINEWLDRVEQSERG